MEVKLVLSGRFVGIEILNREKFNLIRCDGLRKAFGRMYKYRSEPLDKDSHSMSSEERPSPITLAESAEYRGRFNTRESLEALTTAAKIIVEENVEHLRKASKRSRLDRLLLAMLDHAPCNDGKRYTAIVIHMAEERGVHEVVSVARMWERYLCMNSE